MDKGLTRYGFCEKCQRNVSNGIGPSSLPILTKWLNMLPSSHVFYSAACEHDKNYHALGKPEANRKLADDLFLLHMKIIIRSKVPFYLRWVYYGMAYRNYFFVRKFGYLFFDYDGCR